MPGAGDALAWDRYAYVKYNPMKYVDPSGKVFIEYRYARNGAYADNNPRTTQQQLEQTYGFTFAGYWTDEEARTIWSGVNAIQNYLDQYLNSSSGISSVEWITKYLHSNFTHDTFNFRGKSNNYVLMGTIHLSGTYFSRDTVVHEFAHILDDRVKMFEKPNNIFEAVLFGGGPADDLFIAMGGTPAGLRCYNGDHSNEWRNDVGVMASLPDINRFENGLYGNYSSADYFAETWEATILNKKAPLGAINWMNNFVSTLP